MNLPCLIAQRLFDIGVRMRDEDDHLMLADKRITDSDRDDIGQLVLMHGKCIELKLNTDQIQAIGLIDAARHVAWLHTKEHLTEEVDTEFWIIQCREAADAYADSKTEQMKYGSAA